MTRSGRVYGRVVCLAAPPGGFGGTLGVKEKFSIAGKTFLQKPPYSWYPLPERLDLLPEPGRPAPFPFNKSEFMDAQKPGKLSD